MSESASVTSSKKSPASKQQMGVSQASKSPRSAVQSSSTHMSNAELEAANLDWVKPPMHKGVWMTYRDDGLLVILRNLDFFLFDIQKCSS